MLMFLLEMTIRMVALYLSFWILALALWTKTPDLICEAKEASPFKKVILVPVCIIRLTLHYAKWVVLGAITLAHELIHEVKKTSANASQSTKENEETI